MKFKQGTDRKQLSLFSMPLDNEIPENHVVRFIDAYVDALDLDELEIDTKDKKKGLGYNPKLYLKIYIYSYLNKLRSSRTIEKECRRNIELIWLTKNLAPDHWSISNFRKNNNKALINLFKSFLRYCYKLKLISLDIVAIDGTKMRGQNHRSNVYKRENIDNKIEMITQKIEEYLSDIDRNDQTDNNLPDYLQIDDITEKLNKLKKNKKKLKMIKEMFENDPDISKLFANDNDCNFQKDNGRTICGYNCQSAVENKNKIIISADVVQEDNDRHQLNRMKDKVKEIDKELNCNKNQITIVADAGYHCYQEITAGLKDIEIDFFVTNPEDSKVRKDKWKDKKDSGKNNPYDRINFKYDEDKNCFICPKGFELLQRKCLKNAHGVKKRTYQCKNCKNCEVFGTCTTDKKGRTISVPDNFKELDEFRNKVNSDLGKKIIRKRKELVEHPFGTMKRHLGYKYFMRKGLANVNAEFHFMSFIYNFKRVIKIIGVKELLNVLN